MIQFNTLEISSDGKNLNIDVSVKDSSYYDNVYLGNIYIDTQDTFVDASAPSNKALNFDLADYKDSIESYTYGYDEYSATSGLYLIPIIDYTTDLELKFKLNYSDDNLRASDKFTLHIIDDNNETIESIDMDSEISINEGILTVTIENAEKYKNSNGNIAIIISYESGDGGGNPNIFRGLDSDENYDIATITKYKVRKFTYYKSKTLELNLDQLSLENSLLYIYAKVSDNSIPASDTPCGEDNIYTLGVLANFNPIYNTGMSYIKSLGDSCNISKDFIFYILEYSAFKLALKTKNYSQANIYWNKFFKNSNTITVNTTSCGCNR